MTEPVMFAFIFEVGDHSYRGEGESLDKASMSMLLSIEKHGTMEHMRQFIAQIDAWRQAAVEHTLGLDPDLDIALAQGKAGPKGVA